MKQALSVLLLISFNVNAEIYPHVSAYLGSVIGDKTAADGNLPAWFSAGLTYEPDKDFEIKLEAFHRSNADKSGVGVSGSEYELNGIRAGFEYKFRKGIR